MEFESEVGGTKFSLEASSSKQQIGRGPGLYSSDRTVSRRHLSLHLLPPRHASRATSTDPDEETRVSFEVTGKNPILVRPGEDGEEPRVFRAGERGQLRHGDRVSLSIKNPRFFLVKKVGSDGGVDWDVLDAVRRREARTLQRRKEEEEEEERKLERDGDDEEVSIGELELGFQPVDLSAVDPVEEFGFIARGHEFDRYPRHKIRAVKDWNWFLDEMKETSESDEEAEENVQRRKHVGRGKRKGEDEEWTGESEEENKLVADVGSSKRPKYSTRSKDKTKQHRKTKEKASVSLKSDIDEDDESLGGFIVSDEGEDEGDLEEEEEEEEEEFEDEEENDE